MNGFDSVEEALEELRNGKIILVTDDPDRENEGDFICAAEFATTENINFMAMEDLPKGEERRVLAKIRYNHQGSMCTIRRTGEDEITAVFDEPQRAITPGQAVVFYEDECVVGGGTIL